MKSLIMAIAFLIISPSIYAQSKGGDVCQEACAKLMQSNFYFVTTFPKDKCVTIKGKLGDQIVEALYSKANKKRRINNYNANIRNFTISGVANRIHVKIIEGIHTYDAANARTMFNVFDNERNKQERLSNLKENQQRGYSIHFKNASFLRSSKDEVTQKIEAFLKGLIK